jgi:hypothetical protein
MSEPASPSAIGGDPLSVPLGGDLRQTVAAALSCVLSESRCNGCGRPATTEGRR